MEDNGESDGVMSQKLVTAQSILLSHVPLRCQRQRGGEHSVCQKAWGWGAEGKTNKKYNTVQEVHSGAFKVHIQHGNYMFGLQAINPHLYMLFGLVDSRALEHLALIIGSQFFFSRIIETVSIGKSYAFHTIRRED